MSEGGRSRGRARGRVRTQPPQQQQQQPPTQARRPGDAPATAPQGQVQRGPPPRQQYPQQQQQQQYQQHHQQQQQQHQQQGGRALHRGARGGPPGGEGLASRMQQMGLGSDTGNGSVAVGRGASRGRRQLIDILKTRPETVETKKGTSGRPVVIKANFFSLKSVPNWCLWQYRIDFSPEEDRIGVRKSLLRVHKDQLGAYIFDGTMMFTGARLEHEEFEVFSKRESDDTTIRITIRRVGELGAGDHMYLQFFNILMRKALSALKLQLVGRDYYDAHAKISVPDYKLELWPGYLTSIRQHEEGILMCAEITHKVMRQDTVLNLLSECRGGGGDYRKVFEAAIIGCIVLTDYNNHTYRVDDVDFNATPASTFKMRDGSEVSYKDYYYKKYQIRINSSEQPLLVSRTKPRERRAGMSEIVYLVPELCRLTGLTNDMRNNFNLMRALADYTRVAPDSRIDKLMKFNRRLENEQQVKKDLMEWNLQLANNLIEFGGRVLPPEKIVQGSGNDQKKYDAGPQTDWTRELRSSPMIYVPSFTNWAVISPSRAKRDTANFVSSVTSAARGMRFVIPQPYFHDIPDDRLTTYIDALEKLIAAKGPQLIMCVVSNNNAQRYGAIKKKCCVDRPVPTQVIVARSMTSKGVMSIATKVAIQMCCKIGGAPWSVEVPLSGLMVVGFDVCHDTNVRSRSYGAMVASLNRPFSRYYSAVSAHTSGEELSNYFSTNIIKALRKYQDYNQNCLPSRILVYRDGVGEGQLNYVYQHEVKLLEDNLKKVYKDQPVRLGFIVVSKRINTRMFLNNQNPPPGTIADDVITLPERYDFYLVSQSVRQGTVSPTSYNILFDTLGLDPDKIQRLTYKLTHLYFNWSGTVRVPAPCQYAHKLAYLVGQAIHQEPAGKLEDILYFL